MSTTTDSDIYRSMLINHSNKTSSEFEFYLATALVGVSRWSSLSGLFLDCFAFLIYIILLQLITGLLWEMMMGNRK